jgi:hypothetical protein
VLHELNNEIPSGGIIEEPKINQISNIVGTNLVKVIFSIFITLLIRIDKFCRKKKTKHVFESYDFLTPKGPRGVFLQKHSKSAISSSRSPTETKFTFLHFQCIGSCTRLLGEHVQKVS